MTKIENTIIKYQIDFEKYKNGQANEVIALLDKSVREIARYVRKTAEIYTKARYKEIAKKIKSVSTALKDNIEKNIDLDGIIDYELKKDEKLLGLSKEFIKKSGVPKIDFLYPSKEQIKTAALFKPVDTKYGMTYQSYLDGIESGLYNTWDSAIRTGYLTGQTTQAVVNSVVGGVSQTSKLTKPGAINSFRNSVYSNTRTVLQSFANETRNRVYEANEKYFGGESEYKYEYLSTLDSRTCIVCGELSGNLFKAVKELPQLPLHRGCRCVIVPYFEIENDVQSSVNGYVDSDVTFEKWLGEQDEKTQKEVLGKTRFELFKKGEKITQFVDNGEVLTLKQLAERGIIEITKDVNTDKEFSKLLENGRKQWNDVKLDLDFSNEEKKEIAFNLDIKENEIDDYIKNARKSVNDFINSEKTEFVHYDRSDLLYSDDFWKEPRLKSQFETKHTLAGYYPEKRRIRENELLVGSEKMKDEYRPIYGTTVRNAKIWEEDRAEYGNIAIVLNKENIKKRTSFTIGDSLNHLTNTSFQNDFGTALSKPNDTVRQLKNYQYLFKDGEIVDKNDYLEIQVWGGIDFRKGDVKEIVINKRFCRESGAEARKLLTERAKKYNIKVRIVEEWK